MVPTAWPLPSGGQPVVAMARRAKLFDIGPQMGLAGHRQPIKCWPLAI